MQIVMTDEERDILIRWKKSSDTYKLVRMKAEAIVNLTDRKSVV